MYEYGQDVSVSQNAAHWGKRGSEAPAFRRRERHE